MTSMLRFFVFVVFLLFVVIGCGLNKVNRVPAGFSTVTVETSGEIYSEEGGVNSQIDLFGNCLPGQMVVYIEVDGKITAASCRRGHYTLSLNLPRSFFKRTGKRRNPSSEKQVTKQISVFHRGHRDSGVISYLSVDPLKKRAVIEKGKNR